MSGNNILIVRVADLSGVDCKTMRDNILEGVGLGVLVLGMDDTLEVLELPPLGGMEVEQAERTAEKPDQNHLNPEQTAKNLEQEAESAPEQLEKPESAAPSEGMEKRAIVQRLKDFRAANGLGSLEAVSMKTAHQKGRRLSSETLRHICADGAPRMPMEDWRKITRALNLLEQTGAADG